MLSENIKALRTARGMSQEELASRLHVVRQTISKWEKGLSVPDADLLQKIAEVFDTDAAALLGATCEKPLDENEVNLLAQELAKINEQLAEKNRRSRRIWKTVAGVLVGIAVLTVLLIVLSIGAFSTYSFEDGIETVTTEMYTEQLAEE